ncbi:MAG: hypothetical protein TECD_00197 [Hyphomicrobiaceae bacterium hypho_1]
MSIEENTLDYEALTQEAMRSVVRRVLKRTVNNGLPGDHHFYISFDTLIPGVILSKRLRERYEDEMTIVLQHRFWDLAVGEEYFEVKLTFDGIPERLVVPFIAIKVFFDPSVRYGLQFETHTNGKYQSSTPAAVERDDIEPFPPSSTETQIHDLVASSKPEDIVFNKPEITKDKVLNNFASGLDARSSDDNQNDSKTDSIEKDFKAKSAKIVSLDAFRRK